jgi:Tol biopolymer transport system component
VARFVDDASGPHLEHIRTVRPPNGHWYETQWWAPDGSGFLYTESHGTAINNELYFCKLVPGRMCQPERLTHDPAWDEQAIFTPDMKKVIFMSTRDHPGAFTDWTTVATALGLPANFDYILILPVFEATFLQPVFEQDNDLYELTLATGQVRRLTKDGDHGWIIPEFAWDPTGTRLLWTESKIDEGVRIDQRLDLIKELGQLVDYVLNGPPKTNNAGPGDILLHVVQRTRIAQYVTP